MTVMGWGALPSVHHQSGFDDFNFAFISSSAVTTLIKSLCTLYRFYSYSVCIANQAGRVREISDDKFLFLMENKTYSKNYKYRALPDLDTRGQVFQGGAKAASLKKFLMYRGDINITLTILKLDELSTFSKHHLYLVPTYSITPKQNAGPIKHFLLFPPPSSPWQPPVCILSLWIYLV